MRKMSRMLLSAFLFAAAVPLGAETIFSEEFDHYGYHPENFNPGASVTEEPGSLKALRIEPKDGKAVKALKKPYALPQDKLTPNAELTFRIRPFGGKIDKCCEAYLLFVKPGAPLVDAKNRPVPGAVKTVVARIDSEKGASLAGELERSVIGTLNLDNRLADHAPLCDWQWYDVKISIDGEHISLGVDRGIMRVESRATLPAGYVLSGINFGGKTPFDVDDVKVVSTKAAPEKTPVPGAPVSVDGRAGTLVWDASGGELMFSIAKIGFPGKIVLKFDDGGEKPVVYTMTSFSQNSARSVVKTVPETKDGKTVNVRKVVNEPVRLEDCGLLFAGPGIRVDMHTIPRLQYRFESWQMRGVVARILAGEFDRAGEHEWIFRLVRSGKNVQLWIDGNFVRNIALENELKSFTAYAPFGSVFRTGRPAGRTAAADPLLQPVDVMPAQAFAGWLGEKDRINPDAGFDTGVCRENLGSFYLECDGYLSRSAFEATPNALIKSVPIAQYIKAQAVCSLGANDPEKSTDVTARITRYLSNGGRTPVAAAWQTVTLPRTEKDPCPANVKRLKDGKFLVTFDLPAGRIQDLIFMEKSDHLVFEALGGLYEKNNYYVSRAGKPAMRPSNVIVHSAVLVKSPVSMMIENGRLGNVFYPDEQPSVTAKLTALKPGKYTVAWTVKDVDGKVVGTSSDAVSFKAAGETADVKKAFTQKEYGYYTFNASLMDGKTVLVSFDGAFANIAPDTRKAGYESPYNTWNFAGAHGTPGDPKVYGELFKRMGIRRTWGWKSEADVPKEYGPITMGQFRSLHIRGKTPEERDKNAEKEIKDLVARYPHVTQALIFHESAGGPLPLELIGEKTEITEEVKKGDELLVRRALAIADAWRKYAPHVKMVIGNTGYSLGAIGRLFRAKYPADKIDYMGEESVGMTCPPERSVAYPSWMLRKLAVMYGYDKVMPEACFEWKSRVCRDFRDTRLHAAFRIRDILIGHAWRYKLLPVSGLSEMANSYYNTIWGDGAFTRWPVFQPYPVLPATCVLTQVLDCVEFIRMIPTGSTTVYMLEFKRGGEFVYACWTARGAVKTAVDFGGAKVTHTSLYGKVSELRSGEVEFREEPCYLISAKPVKSAAAAMERTYPDEVYGMKDAKVACAMDKAEDWKLIEGEDKRLITPLDPPHLTALRPGKFKLAQVKDEKKGDCLEVTLIPEGERAELISEYGFIRLEKPVTIPGTPSTLGIWAKGNSSWGKLYFELEDADGEIWVSAGTGGYGCQVYDWPEQMALNFDGWHFVQFPLTGASPVKIHSPGETQWQWQCDRSGDGKVTFPVKLRGVGFSLTRKTLNLTEMVDVKNLSVRFRDFSAY